MPLKNHKVWNIAGIRKWLKIQSPSYIKQDNKYSRHSLFSQIWYFPDGRHKDTLGGTMELKIVLIIKDLTNKEQSSATWNWKWRQMPESGASFESAEWCCALCCLTFFPAPPMYLCIKHMYLRTEESVYLAAFKRIVQWCTKVFSCCWNVMHYTLLWLSSLWLWNLPPVRPPFHLHLY